VRVYRARRDITRPRVLFSEFAYVDNSGRAVHDDAWQGRIASATGKRDTDDSCRDSGADGRLAGALRELIG
jgi:hypothetical protein